MSRAIIWGEMRGKVWIVISFLEESAVRWEVYEGARYYIAGGGRLYRYCLWLYLSLVIFRERNINSGDSSFPSYYFFCALSLAILLEIKSSSGAFSPLPSTLCESYIHIVFTSANLSTGLLLAVDSADLGTAFLIYPKLYLCGVENRSLLLAFPTLLPPYCYFRYYSHLSTVLYWESLKTMG